MEVADLDLLILADDAALDAADGDSADVFIIIQTADQHLEGGVEIHLGCGDVLQNRLEKGLEIRALDVRGIACRAVAAGAEEHRGIQLFIRGVQIHQQLKHLIHDLVNTLVRAVDLIEDDDDPMPQLESPAQHEARLGHGPLRGVHQQDDAVHHFQDALHFPAEIGMARGIHNVDLRIAVKHGGVLCHNRNAALALEVVGVHDAVDNFLILAVHAGLFEHLVHQRGFSMVNMRDNRDISQFIHPDPSLLFYEKGL